MEDALPDEEWATLKKSSQNESELLNCGLIWLKKRHSTPFAGIVLTELLKIGGEQQVATLATRWLRRYSDHEIAPELIGAMLVYAPSSEIVQLGIQYLRTTEDLKKIRSIIYAMHERPQPDEFLQAVKFALEKQPQHRQWYFSIAEVRNECEPRVEKLILRWIELNYERNLDLLRLMVPTPTRAVFEACFSWICSREDKESQMTGLLPYLVEGAATKHVHLYTEIMTMIRAWIARNPTHRCTGSVQQALIKYSKDDADILAARIWLKSHWSTESAWLAVTALIRKDVMCRSTVEPFLLQTAREYLRNKSPSSWEFQAILRDVLLVQVDEELIAWGKECGEDEPNLLIPILLRAPDDEIIRLAEYALEGKKRMDRGSLISALLHANPENLVAQKWAAKHSTR